MLMPLNNMLIVYNLCNNFINLGLSFDFIMKDVFSYLHNPHSSLLPFPHFWMIILILQLVTFLLLNNIHNLHFLFHQLKTIPIIFTPATSLTLESYAIYVYRQD